MDRKTSELLVVVFGTSAAADAWMRSPVPMLGGRAPEALVDEGRGDEVAAVLAGLASGAHA